MNEVGYNSGWIKIHRSLVNKGWYSNSAYVHLWVHMIFTATHKPVEYLWNGTNITLQSGQFITTRKKLSRETRINENKVERILKFFETEQQIEQQTSSTSRLISICKYNEYQKGEQQSEQQVNNGRTTSEQRVNTKQELKEYKEDIHTTHEVFEVAQKKKKVAPTPLVVQFQDFEFNGYAEKKEEILKFASFVDNELPRVMSLEHPITPKQACDILTRGIDKGLIVSVFRDMENKKTLLKDYTSAFKTFLSWVEIRNKNV